MHANREISITGGVIGRIATMEMNKIKKEGEEEREGNEKMRNLEDKSARCVLLLREDKRETTRSFLPGRLPPLQLELHVAAVADLETLLSWAMSLGWLCSCTSATYPKAPMQHRDVAMAVVGIPSKNCPDIVCCYCC